jgi:hypothetical protein
MLVGIVALVCLCINVLFLWFDVGATGVVVKYVLLL